MSKLPLILLLLALSGHALAGPDGKALYIEHCSACHHTRGEGGIGLPLTKDTLSSMTDSYLRKSIYYGRPGRVMPAFPTLSDAQSNSIIKYLRESTGSKPAVYAVHHAKGQPSAGKALYEEHCVKCHAADGTGQGSGTGVTLSRERSFLVMPPAISNAGFLASASDEMMKHVILHGREKQDMPAFANNLSDQEVHDVIAYIRSLDLSAVTPPPLDSDERPTHVIESPYDFNTTVKNLQQAIEGANFRIFPPRYLEQGLVDEFSVNKRQIGVRFCNFDQLYGMLKVEPRLGTVLPCRITVMELADEKVILVVPNLRVIARLFNNDELVELWDQMEEALTDLTDEATL